MSSPPAARPARLLDRLWLAGVVRARSPERLPVVLTRREVRAILARMSGQPRLVAALLYGSGLRLLEALSLRVKDVDFERRELLVRRARVTKTGSAFSPAL